MSGKINPLIAVGIAAVVIIASGRPVRFARRAAVRGVDTGRANTRFAPTGGGGTV